MNTISNEIAQVARAALDYIDALPSDVIARLPTMPGFDRDWAENALRKEREAAVLVYQERRFHVSGKKQIEYWAEINKGAYQYLPESERRIVYAVPPAQPVAVPDGIHPDTADLVTRFAAALAEKLHKAEQKYGYSNGWMRPDWYNECLQSLREHIEKGDPRDVAAYCAFMWHHGWVTTDACRAAMLAAPGKEG